MKYCSKSLIGCCLIALCAMTANFSTSQGLTLGSFAFGATNEKPEKPEKPGRAKVAICHTPKGSKSNPSTAHTIIISESAVKAHLKHGDTLGPCATPGCTSAGQCDDSNACTFDNCVSGTCTNTVVSCDDSNPCTANTCVPATGCTATLVLDGTLCNDGQACTSSDQCLAGSCQGAPVICSADACNTSTCNLSSGSCVTVPIDFEDNNVCTIDSCDSILGPQHTTIANCCLSDSECNDSNICTADTCSASNQCSFAAIVGQACSDNNLCTSSDVCTASGSCTGTALDCADTDPCTLDSCDTISGLCLNVGDASLAGAACDDGISCTSSDQCNSLAQCSGADSCVAPVACSTTSCNLASGLCEPIANDAACDDQISCTADSCSLTEGCLRDTFACECIANTSDIRCDDSSPCTNDTCSANYECQHDITGTDGLACSDSNACTSPDTCLTGVCAAGAAIDCNDSDACTSDSCVASTGCQFDAVVCNDSNICTADTCDSGTGCAFTAIDPTQPTQCTSADATQCANLNSDPNNCGTCFNVCPSGVCTDGVCTTAGPSLAFTTSTLQRGNLGGLSGADAICQARASAAGLTGTFVAYLSASTVDAKDRISDVAYFRVGDGALIANSKADLTDGSIANTMSTEFGSLELGRRSFAWTGTSLGLKSPAGTGQGWCEDWTSDVTTDAAVVGSNVSVSSTWEKIEIFDGFCDGAIRLYCFQSN
ncbi:MAG: hypothetical protein JKY15_04020 [Deltaproteobacteria bacterium]|nr:hypothetical protein [Deltaproteobacteria bacterium]